MRMHAACAHVVLRARRTAASEGSGLQSGSDSAPARPRRPRRPRLDSTADSTRFLSFRLENRAFTLSHTRGAGDWDAGVQAAF